MGLTLKEIAKELNLSPAAVSKALKDYPDISDLTKKRVKEYAKKSNYQPNTQAAYLRTKKTQLIGLIIPNIDNYFFFKVLEGMLQEANKNQYHLIICNSDELQDLEKEIVAKLLHQKVDGIFISLTKNTINFDHLNKVLNSETSLIMFDRTSKLINCSKVVIDDKKMGFTATKHLIDKGCKKIGNLRGALIPQNSIDQFSGYKSALEKNNLEFDPNLVTVSKEGTVEDGYQLTRKLFEKGLELDGLICFTDSLAIGAVKFCKENGIDIPSKIRISGFGDIESATLVTPAITFTSQGAFKMGVKSMGLFLKEQQDLKQKINISIKTIILKTNLIQRESTA
jgi:LacI family transcriptional regulator